MAPGAPKDEMQTVNHGTGDCSETRPLLERDGNDNRSTSWRAPVEPLTALVLLVSFFQDNVYDQYFYYYYQCKRYNVTFSLALQLTVEHDNQVMAQGRQNVIISRRGTPLKSVSPPSWSSNVE
ncbi:hypothetical protein Bbelb_205920 [Branchiostoma belcheri]|nr:hypothetical protein Bbelb_205920 [Branchiostoma belcheri]